ncbi:MAG TPA: ATP-grasp domain-containing protein [bacterium]|nr:ATP-grasp domain-containing protein [bacterium]
MKKFKILVFPCGSEIGLEIHRSLRYSAHLDLYGGSSVDDHGRFVFEKYIGGIPFIDSPDVISSLKETIVTYGIDAIYPTMDKVIWKLKAHEEELGCKVISSCLKTTEMCLSKKKTYALLADKTKTPKIFGSLGDVEEYPIFIKPDIGYGTRGVFKAESREKAEGFLSDKKKEDHVLSEYLPSDEFTVDCFTNRKRELMFVGPRKRWRIVNGISVNTTIEKDEDNEFVNMARLINDTLEFRGAWFFQVKKDKKGHMTLLEVASRLGGSSSLYRGRGINFALLSVYDAFNVDVEILANQYGIEMDRALDNKYKLDLEYSTIYVDYDDCLLIDNKVNHELLSFLFKALNQKKKIFLLSKHEGDLTASLKTNRLEGIFDRVIQIGKNERKVDHLDPSGAIFIDDSFAERKAVSRQYGIPVFSPDMIETLI